MIEELYTFTNEQLIEIIYSLLGIITVFGIYAIADIIISIIKYIFKKNEKHNKKTNN